MDALFWDQRYRSSSQLFSGKPNPVLVTEAADLRPGQALDVGCGEGADALWLASRGWQVTAVDISRVALERAGTRTAGMTRAVAWTRADLTATEPPAGAFDLVSAQYFPLPRQPGDIALRGLLAAVAPEGTLLIVGHDLADLPAHRDDADPSDYYQPDDIARLLDDDWTVLVSETRPRTTPAPPGTSHTHDTILRAQRAHP